MFDAKELARWLPEAQAGSREALGQALEACRAYLLLIANRQLDPALRAKGGASDIVQETFFEAQRDFGQFHGQTGEELQAWLRQLLLHNVANFARGYREAGKRLLTREVRLDPETPSGTGDRGLADDTPSPSGRAMAHEQAEAVQQALARMPEDYRQVVVLRYQDGLSFAEVAERLQRSENAARKLWFRALERLEEELRSPP